MYSTTKEGRRKYSQDVYDDQGNWIRADLMEEDTCKIIALQINIPALMVEAVVGYGHTEVVDGVSIFTLKRTHNIVIQNRKDRLYFKELCNASGGDDKICADGVLDFLANHPEDKDFAVMRVATKDKIVEAASAKLIR